MTPKSGADDDITTSTTSSRHYKATQGISTAVEQETITPPQIYAYLTSYQKSSVNTPVTATPDTHSAQPDPTPKITPPHPRGFCVKILHCNNF